MISEKQMLLAELENSSPKVTGHKMACIIKTKNNTYCGHNTEEFPNRFSHAEEKALKKMIRAKDFSGIKSVYIAGKGHEKVRLIISCNECFNLLKPFFAKDYKIVIYEPNTLSYKLIFSKKDLEGIYAKKEPFKLGGKEIGKIKKELKKTPLIPTHVEFIAQLRLFGLKERISFYLAGAASGRVELSNLINKRLGKKYSDLDMSVVSSQARKKVERKLIRFVSRFFKDLKTKRKKRKLHFINENRNCLYFYSGKKRILDFAVGKTLRDTMLRRDHYKKNFFIKLS